MGKKEIHEHTASYHAITGKSPQGFQCLKRLFIEYDNQNPSRGALESLLARDFVRLRIFKFCPAQEATQ